jgi:predicted ATPase
LTIKIKCLTAINDNKHATETCREALSLLGIKIPKMASTPSIIISAIKTGILLPSKKIKEIENYKEMEDEKIQLAMQILFQGAYSYYFYNLKTYPILMFKMVQLSVKYGNCPESIIGYGSYGLILASVLKKIDDGIAVGDQAMLLLDKYDNETFVPAACFVDATFIRHYTTTPNQLNQIYKRGYLSGIKVGDLPNVGWNSILEILNRIATGDFEYISFKEQIQSALNYNRQNKQYNQVDKLIPYLDFLDSIAKVKINPYVLSDDIDFEEFVAVMSRKVNATYTV